MLTRLPKIRLLSALTLFAFYVGSAFGVDPAWPNLNNDSQKVRFLLWTQRHIPGLFQATVIYKRDWFTLLEEQMNVLRRLEQHAWYQKLKPSNPPMIHVKVFEAAAKTDRATSEFDPIAWERVLKQAVNDKDGSAKQVIASLQMLRKGNPDGLRTALIRAGHLDQQKEWFKITDWPTLKEMLRKALPEKLPESFRAHEFGFPTSAPNKVEALELVDLFYSERRRLKSGVESFVLSHAGTPEGLNPERVKDALADLKNHARQAFATLSPKESQKISLLIDEVGLKALDPFVRSPDALKMSLVEIPAQLAIFRGCVGNDCATQYSASYAQSPMERVFLVQDPEGLNKGYVSTTLVHSNEKTALYLHTVSGPRISSSDAEVILDVFLELKSVLNVDEILVPVSTQIASLINFESIRTAFEARANSQATRKMEYYDSVVRDDILDPTSAMEYDRPGKNRMGNLLHKRESAKTRLEVSSSALDHIALPEIDVKPALLLALDHEFIDEHAIADRILAASAISKTAFTSLTDALYNDHREDYEAYLSKIRFQFSNFGWEIDEKFIDEHFIYFQQGILKSPDLLRTHTATARDFLRWMMSRTELPSEDAKKAIQEFLGKNQEFFLSLKPTLAEKIKLLKWTPFVDANHKAKIVTSAIESLETFADLERFTSSLTDAFGEASIAQYILPALLKHGPLFRSEDEKTADLRRKISRNLTSWRKKIAKDELAESWSELFRYQLELQTDPAEFLDLFSAFDWKLASTQSWTRATRAWVNDAFKHFLALSPSAKHVQSAKNLYVDIMASISPSGADGIVQLLLESLMTEAKTIPELLALTQGDWEGAKASYIWEHWQTGSFNAALATLIPQMKRLRPKEEDWKALRINLNKLGKHAVTVSLWSAYQKLAAAVSTKIGVEAYLDQVDVKFRSTHAAYFSATVRESPTTWAAFRAMQPTPKQTADFLERSVLSPEVYAEALRFGLASARDDGTKRLFLQHEFKNYLGTSAEKHLLLRRSIIAVELEAATARLKGSPDELMKWFALDASTPSIVARIDREVQTVQTPQAFIEFVRSSLKITAHQWIPSPRAFAHLKTLRPTIRDLGALKTVLSDEAFSEELRRRAFMTVVDLGMPTVGSAAEYIELLDFSPDAPKLLLRDIQTYHELSQARFQSLRPTSDELRKATTRFGRGWKKVCSELLRQTGW